MMASQVSNFINIFLVLIYFIINWNKNTQKKIIYNTHLKCKFCRKTKTNMKQIEITSEQAGY